MFTNSPTANCSDLVDFGPLSSLNAFAVADCCYMLCNSAWQRYFRDALGPCKEIGGIS